MLILVVLPSHQESKWELGLILEFIQCTSRHIYQRSFEFAQHLEKKQSSAMVLVVWCHRIFCTWYSSWPNLLDILSHLLNSDSVVIPVGLMALLARHKVHKGLNIATPYHLILLFPLACKEHLHKEEALVSVIIPKGVQKVTKPILMKHFVFHGKCPQGKISLPQSWAKIPFQFQMVVANYALTTPMLHWSSSTSLQKTPANFPPIEIPLIITMWSGAAITKNEAMNFLKYWVAPIKLLTSATLVGVGTCWWIQSSLDQFSALLHQLLVQLLKDCLANSHFLIFANNSCFFNVSKTCVRYEICFSQVELNIKILSEQNIENECMNGHDTSFCKHIYVTGTLHNPKVITNHSYKPCCIF